MTTTSHSNHRESPSGTMPSSYAPLLSKSAVQHICHRLSLYMGSATSPLITFEMPRQTGCQSLLYSHDQKLTPNST